MNIPFGLTFAGRAGRRSVGLVIAVAATAALASPTLAVDFGSPVVLYKAPSGAGPTVEDMAARGSSIVVAWTHQLFDVPSTIRWSTDGGQAFAPAVSLSNRSKPKVDTCAGYAWAISDSATDQRKARIDGWSLYGSSHLHWSLGADTFGGDVACVGKHTLATVWHAMVNGQERLKVRLWHLQGAVLVSRATFDLGAVHNDYFGLTYESSVSASTTTVHVAWMDGHNLRFKRIDVGPGTDPAFTARSTKTITTFVTDSAGAPLLATDGDRVVLAYQYRAQVRVRVSNTNGISFSAFTTVVDLGSEPSAQAGPYSLDAFGGDILLEAYRGGGDSIESVGFLSHDGGATWPTTSISFGWQVGALSGTVANPVVAEAWDTYFPHEEPAHHKIRFHTGMA